MYNWCIEEGHEFAVSWTNKLAEAKAEYAAMTDVEQMNFHRSKERSILHTKRAVWHNALQYSFTNEDLKQNAEDKKAKKHEIDQRKKAVAHLKLFKRKTAAAEKSKSKRLKKANMD